MKIITEYIDVNGFSRPGKKRPATLAIVLHNVGVPRQSARAVRDYFNSLKNQNAMDNKPDISASAHYVIDLDGSIIALIPEDEKAYHCGTSQKDPASRQLYTNRAREVLGFYAEKPNVTSPNSATIGIEMCHDDGGVFTPETLQAARELCVNICKTYQLDPLKQILTHNEIVGWKECPFLWTRRPTYFMDFKLSVCKDIYIKGAKNEA
jgi:N-acetylmuramoyl-L-alanine amidase